PAWPQRPKPSKNSPVTATWIPAGAFPMHTESVSPAPALFISEAPPASSLVTLQFEGRPLRVPAGISVAAALLLHGGAPYRSTPVGAAPRAPYCMMGVCFECLVEI